MSEDNGMMLLCCASCGIAEVDDIKLKQCDDCDLVRYCSDECQRDHKSEHEEACKERVAELKDKILFKQPDSTHRGDCPICYIPMPLDRRKAITNICCGTEICNGCLHADLLRMREGRLQDKCAFCREPIEITEQQSYERRMKRVEANDPAALQREGCQEYAKGNHSKAFEYWTKAAELGDAIAHHGLALLYKDGEGVEKDGEKELYHLEEAAIGGHPTARFLLGCYELSKGNAERAVKHYIIAATHGHDDSIKVLMDLFKEGIVSKEELAAALRAHQAAVDATKSPHRDAEEKYQRLWYQENN